MFLQKLLPVTITDVAEYNYNKFARYVGGRDFCALSHRIDTDAVIDGAELKSDSVTFFPAITTAARAFLYKRISSIPRPWIAAVFVTAAAIVFGIYVSTVSSKGASCKVDS